MTWLVLVVAVVLVGLTVAAVLGRIDGSLREPTRSLAYVPLPDDRLTPDDLEGIRLDTGLRGYRMDQVDEVIGRLAEEVGDLRASLEVARQAAAAAAGAAGSAVAPGAAPATDTDAERRPDAPGADLVGDA